MAGQTPGLGVCEHFARSLPLGFFSNLHQLVLPAWECEVAEVEVNLSPGGSTPYIGL